MRRRTFVGICLGFCGLGTALGAKPHVVHRLARYRVSLRRRNLRRWVIVIAQTKSGARKKARHACPGWRVKRAIRIGWW